MNEHVTSALLQGFNDLQKNLLASSDSRRVTQMVHKGTRLERQAPEMPAVAQGMANAFHSSVLELARGGEWESVLNHVVFAGRFVSSISQSSLGRLCEEVVDIAAEEGEYEHAVSLASVALDFAVGVSSDHLKESKQMIEHALENLRETLRDPAKYDPSKSTPELRFIAGIVDPEKLDGNKVVADAGIDPKRAGRLLGKILALVDLVDEKGEVSVDEIRERIGLSKWFLWFAIKMLEQKGTLAVNIGGRRADE